MPRSERSKSFRFSFVLTPENIRAFDEIIGRISEELSYSVRCSDQSVIQFQSLDELLKFPDTKFRKILRLTISAGNYDIDYASVEFDASGKGEANVEFTVRGDDDMVVLESYRLEEQILRTRQWYSALGQNFSGVVLLILLLFAFVWGAIEFISWSLDGFPVTVRETQPNKKGSPPGGVWVFLISSAIIGFLCISAIGTYFLEPMRLALFPKGEFAIGDGSIRISSTRFWRRIVGSSILLATGVSLTSAFLWSFISG